MRSKHGQQNWDATCMDRIAEDLERNMIATNYYGDTDDGIDEIRDEYLYALLHDLPLYVGYAIIPIRQIADAKEGDTFTLKFGSFSTPYETNGISQKIMRILKLHKVPCELLTGNIIQITVNWVANVQMLSLQDCQGGSLENAIAM